MKLAPYRTRAAVQKSTKCSFRDWNRNPPIGTDILCEATRLRDWLAVLTLSFDVDLNSLGDQLPHLLNGVFDVPNALPCLPMRRNNTAITLKQHWARMGNIFSYFSPAATRPEANAPTHWI
jgi:hypothetical protein